VRAEYRVLPACLKRHAKRGFDMGRGLRKRFTGDGNVIQFHG
jgi:hypothetical protein